MLSSPNGSLPGPAFSSYCVHIQCTYTHVYVMLFPIGCVPGPVLPSHDLGRTLVETHHRGQRGPYEC
jgi:hypothetical protein